MRALVVAAGLLALAGCRPAPIAPASQPGPPVVPPPPPCTVRLGYLEPHGVYYLLDYLALDTLDPRPPVARPVVPDIAGWVAYSANSHRMAYLGRDDQVHLADLATGLRWVVGRADNPADPVFALSPDGAKVALIEKGNVRVWLANNPTGSHLAAAKCPKPPASLAWSPDSKLVAMSTMAAVRDETNDGGIWLLQEGLSQPKRLVAPGPRGEGCSRDLMWSPDGKWLAWARGYGDGWTGDLARADGSDLRRDAIGAGPREWLPDSRGLIVDIHVEAGAFRAGLYSLRMSKVIPFVSGVIRGHCLSPDGSSVLVFPLGDAKGADMLDLGSGMGTPWGPKAVIEGAAWLADGRVPKDEYRFPWRIACAVRDPRTHDLRLWFVNRAASRTKETTLPLDPEFGPRSLRWIDLP